jgi:hypothetical protein
MSFLSSLIEITTWRLPSDVSVEGDDIVAAGEGYRQVPSVWIGKLAGDFGLPIRRSLAPSLQDIDDVAEDVPAEEAPAKELRDTQSVWSEAIDQGFIREDEVQIAWDHLMDTMDILREQQLTSTMVALLAIMMHISMSFPEIIKDELGDRLKDLARHQAERAEAAVLIELSGGVLN